MRKVRRTLPILLSIVLLAGLISCASFEQNTYKSLYVAGTTYDTAMKSVSSLQKQGFVTDAQRIEINKYANYYYVSYQVAVDAFSLYKRTKTRDAKDKVISAVAEVFLKWPTLAEYVNRIKPGTLPGKLEEVK